jgi:hypothetical protein
MLSNDQTPERIPRFTRSHSFGDNATNPMRYSMLQKLRDPRGLALGRTAVGVTMLTAPDLIPQLLGASAESRESMGWAVQMLGAREVALGLGALATRKEKRLWHAAGLLCDTVDALAVASAISKGRVRSSAGAGLVVIAAVAAVTGADALRRG